MSPLSLLTQDITSFVLWIMAIVYAITVHEFSHAVSAATLGDSTPDRQGRVTLNPLAHIDPLGLLFLVVVGFGWGRPVQFDPYQLKHPRRDSALISIAGPISNFISAVAFALIAGAYMSVAHAGQENLLVQFLTLLIFINIALGIFNLLPIPPLDGSRLVTALLPDRGAWFAFKMWLERSGPVLLISLLILDRLTNLDVFGFLFNLIWGAAAALIGLL